MRDLPQADFGGVCEHTSICVSSAYVYARLERERERGGERDRRKYPDRSCVRFRASAGGENESTSSSSTGWRTFFARAYYIYIFLLNTSLGEKSLTNAPHTIIRSIGCANSGAASHCRLIFERLVYTRLVLKVYLVAIYTHNRGGRRRGRRRWTKRERGEGGREFGDRVDKAADVIREIQGPSISDRTNEPTWPTKHWPN